MLSALRAPVAAAVGCALLASEPAWSAEVAAATAVPPPGRLREDLVDIVSRESSKYNCSISITIRSADWEVSVANGIVDFASKQPAKVSDIYAWGSVTKSLTAASILKLVSGGAFSLDDEVGPLVDPMLERMRQNDPSQNFSSVEDLWGKSIRKTTVRKLLSMSSGVPDFDTAQPSLKGGYEDPLRAQLYDRPSHDFTPVELMSVPWVAHQWKKRCSLPGPFGFCYSSTNFMLLGLILAAQAGIDRWEDLDQGHFLPEYLRSRVQFAMTGGPKQLGLVHGYDRTAYNMPKGTFNDHDNWEVDGVFAGWTASNIVMNASTAANMAWEIYGPPRSVAPSEYVEKMIPRGGMKIYGLGTFNLGFFSGQKGVYGEGYGHLGATYGYQSVVGYFPGANIALAIATNIETNTQSQPSDTMCSAYNAALGAVLNKTLTCSFVSQGYYGGECKCDNVLEEPGDLLVV